jgi:hypothetical protein
MERLDRIETRLGQQGPTSIDRLTALSLPVRP